MNYAIIENEHLALELMKAIIKRVRPEWELAFTAGTVADTVSFFKTHPDVDLCFMDIELNDGDCFDIFDEVEMGVPVIFTTAYDDFLLKAFKVYSIDYLLKPVLETDIEQAIQKYERYYAKERGSSTVLYRHLKNLAEAKSQKPALRRVLTVTGDHYSFVEIDNIAWLISEDKYVYVVDKDGNRRLTTFETLTDANEVLDESSFFCLRRNLICSPSAIKSVTKYFKGRLKVKLQSHSHEVEAVVSSNKRDTFLSWLGGA